MDIPRRPGLRGWFWLWAVMAAGVPLEAFIVMPGWIVPIDRMLANATKKAQEEPDSPQAHYEIARLHYLIFTSGLSPKLDDPFSTDSWDSSGRGDYWKGQVNLDRARRSRAVELAREDIDEMRWRIPASKQRAFDAAFTRRLKQLEQSRWTPATSFPSRQMSDHVVVAMRELMSACRLSPENAHYLLFQACLAEQFLIGERL